MLGILTVLGSLAISTFGLAATSAKDFTVSCNNSSAKVEMWGDTTQFHLRYQNGAGFTNFPIFTGVVTPAFLPEIEQNAKDLSVFTGEVLINWDVNKCQTDSKRPYLVQCSGLGTIAKPENSNFVAANLQTTASQVENLDITSSVINVDLSLVKSQNVIRSSYFLLSLPFDQHRCSLTAAIHPE